MMEPRRRQVPHPRGMKRLRGQPGSARQRRSGRILRYQEPEVPGTTYRLVAPTRPELAEDAPHMAADGVHGDEHRGGDLVGRQQLGEVTEDLALLRRQR